MFRSIPGLYPRDADSISPTVVTAKYISRHCQMSPVCVYGAGGRRVRSCQGLQGEWGGGVKSTELDQTPWTDLGVYMHVRDSASTQKQIPIPFPKVTDIDRGAYAGPVVENKNGCN